MLASLPAAMANSPEIFGLSSRWSAMGDASTAIVDDSAAAFYNPAGLAMGLKPAFQLGILGYGGRLSLPGGSDGMDNPFEGNLGIVFPFPLKGSLRDRIWLGLSFVFHPELLARVKARFPTEIFYPYYDNRTQRLMLLPGLAARILDSKLRGRLVVGASLNVITPLTGKMEGTEGASRAVEARMSQTLGTSARVIAGASYHLLAFHLGLVYRQQSSMRFATKSLNHVAGTDLDVDIETESLYNPHTFVLGFAWTPRAWTVSLDVAYMLWRLYSGPYVRIKSLLPLVGDLVGDRPDIQFNDAVAVRAGVERVFQLKKTMTLKARAGLGFESSFVPVQHGRTNMLDGHKLIMSLGTGLDLGRLLKRRLFVDLHFRAQFVLPRKMDKRVYIPEEECPGPPAGSVDPDKYLIDELPCDRTDPSTLGIQISNPGYPSVKGGGWVLSGGMTVGVEL